MAVSISSDCLTSVGMEDCLITMTQTQHLVKSCCELPQELHYNSWDKQHKRETIYGFILKNIFVSFLQVLVIEAETLQVKVSSTRKYIFHCQIRKCLNPGTTI